MTSIDDEFTRILEDIFKQISVDQRMRLNPVDHGNGPWFYGYSMVLGPDGKPIIREFGKMNPVNGLEAAPENMQINHSAVDSPLTQLDVDEKLKKVRVLVDLPGFEKKSIKVSARQTSVKIIAKDASREVETKVPLNITVDPDSAEATYNNGVLDLTLNIIKADEVKDVDIQVN
jgi:HSP20 family protein